MSQDKHTARNSRWQLFVSATLLLLTLLVYLPSFQYPFVNYDDPVYVFDNPHVQAGLTASGLRWAFTTFACGNWHPLTWLSLQLDAELFGGQNAGAFHRTNVGLHAANTLLLFLILVRMTQEAGRSAMVAGLFALHPLHVESVAWVSERKDVLSTFFWFVTMAAYLYYLNRPSIRRYLPLFLALGLGLLAKPMLVTLPCVLLLLDYWPLRRWPERGFRDLLLEKAPLFAVVLASCLVTFSAQFHGQAVAPVEAVSLTARLGNGLLAYSSYLGKMLWPVHLAVYYPHVGPNPTALGVVAAALLLFVITGLVLGAGRRWPYLPVGWLWYLGTLVPVIGLVQVGSQGMADRYTYVPLIGVFVMLTWSAADVATAWKLPRSYLASAAVLGLSVCSVLTWLQLNCWKSTCRLWECTVAATENNVLAHVNLGVCYADEGRITDAQLEFVKAAALDPLRTEPHVNLGNVYFDLALLERAAVEYRTAIELAPQLAGPHFNLGNTLAQMGQHKEAIAEYRRAIDLNPGAPASHINLGVQLDLLGKSAEAAAAYRAAIELDPGNALVHSNLATLLAEMGQLDEALTEYRYALELGDTQVPPRLQVCERMRTLRPRLADVIAGREQPADNNERLGFALLCAQRQQRRYALAVRLYREAFHADPRLIEDPRNGHRFRAAAAAAAAGCGQNAVALSEPVMANLRRQALQWLRADLQEWSKLAPSAQPEIRAVLGQTLRRWQRDVHFAGVRDPAALAQRPDTERQAWRNLWNEAAALLERFPG